MTKGLMWRIPTIALLAILAMPCLADDPPKADPSGIATGDKTSVVDAAGNPFVAPLPADKNSPDYLKNKKDYEGNFFKTLEMVPTFAERLRGAKREDRLYGALTPNYFCKPYGPVWALVGDAGYQKDPITAQGITNALCEAELLAGAIVAGLDGARPLSASLAEHHRRRDAAIRPMYDFTVSLAGFATPSVAERQLLAGVVALSALGVWQLNRR